MICKKCGKEHDGSYGEGNFCSSKCSHSRTWTPEVNRSRSEKSRKAYSEHHEKYVTFRENSQSAEAIKKRAAKILARSAATPFEDLGYGSKKERVVREQGGKCLICGIDEWNGKPISLRLDHIDGVRSNNSRSNFRGICPNCDSQLPTYCGNKVGRSSEGRISDEQLLEALRTSETVSQALRKVGLSDSSGSRYLTRCVRILDSIKSAA
jgi:hypothetical protein